MNQREFEDLKLYADRITLDLNLFNGGGATIHNKNMLLTLIRMAISYIEKYGESPKVTLETLERRIFKAEKWLEEQRRLK